ncbi:2-aminoethylphosphonate--pyruvate transaminase [Stappia stellulata]|uniref:2-aminoethylphosphonate--pyruvate transaminase n=1 Tax=Stappia stellulata TaxID=71235 RepID=UPI0003FCB0DB|nr:2-aminoethylphosphonate--pyruvate transaminase [Stappia stellulata]
MSSAPQAKTPATRSIEGKETPVLLTPGPLTTSARVKEAMLRDWGSRDPAFVALSQGVFDRIRALSGGTAEDHVCVPLQGSGTFAVEAMLTTFVGAGERVLLLVNGAYGHRMADICRKSGRAVEIYEVAETEVHDPAEVSRRLRLDPAIAFVAMVHCETTSGLLNPLEDIASCVRAEGRWLLVDSMSGFGALSVDMSGLELAAMAASSNKCLQGVPGLGFVVCRKELLEAARGRAPSVVLDLQAQAAALANGGQWRFTPPTHVIAALDAALAELEEEGGPPARLERYSQNLATLLSGMDRLGFQPALDPARQAPVIASFVEPADDWFSFETFYEALRARGFAIYAGKMTGRGTFRVGVIGAIDSLTIEAFLTATKAVVSEMKQKVIS